jgi:hypothetical protein
MSFQCLSCTYNLRKLSQLCYLEAMLYQELWVSSDLFQYQLYFQCAEAFQCISFNQEAVDIIRALYQEEQCAVQQPGA